MDLTFWGGGGEGGWEEGGPLLSMTAALPDKCASPTIEVCICVCVCVCVRERERERERECLCVPLYRCCSTAELAHHRRMCVYVCVCELVCV